MRLASLLLCAGLLAAQPVPVVFDTDMGNDVDDALALAVLHALESRGEARIAAVTITKDNPWAAPYIDAVDTFYGRPDIPIGMVKASGITPRDSAMIHVPAARRRPDGTLVYRRGIAGGSDAPDAVALLRRTLAAEKDGSVVIVQVGFSTNLARLLAEDRALVARKVRLLSVMAGDFAKPRPEFNVATDIPSARKLFAEWPTSIVASGFEIGSALLFPASSIQRDFAYVPDHPVAEAYRNYKPMPYDRPTWDLTSALYAVRPDRGYFRLSAPGRISVDARGVTSFTPDPAGTHRYLILDDAQRARTLESLILLASEPPTRRR